jgi:hypothetical protein
MGRASTNDAASVFDNKVSNLSQTSRSLFHYTDVDGLIGILENQTLRATHSDFLNDSTECRTILSILLPMIETELREIVPKLVDLKVLNPTIMTDFGGEIYKLEAQKMLQAMVSATNNVAPYFITSFCIHDPSDPAYQHGLLSQWRGYARGGFAIEFDEVGLDKLNMEENKTHRYQGLVTEKVIYRDHADHVKSEAFSGLAGALLKNIFPKASDKLTGVLGSKSTDDIGKSFLSTAPFLKNASFEEENEYRIVALCNRPSVADPNDKRAIKPIQFRGKSNGEIIPFIALYEEMKITLPIKSIIAGPHHQQSSRIAALEILLEKCKLDVPIRSSEIPFRQ